VTAVWPGAVDGGAGRPSIVRGPISSVRIPSGIEQVACCLRFLPARISIVGQAVWPEPWTEAPAAVDRARLHQLRPGFVGIEQLGLLLAVSAGPDLDL
jgi:hypothetical protein